MNSVIWLFISRARFHRGGKEWRLYNIKMIQHKIYQGKWTYIIEAVKNSKNTHRRNHKQIEENHQPIYVQEPSLFYSALQLHFMTRGNKRSDALFLQPLDNWRV